MALPFFNWSKTAASNATADSTVNWAEGQSPSSVNDSARAMMASTAAWRDDISGTITTGGTSTAYTVTSNQVFDTLAHMSGAMIAFTPHTTCGASPTLNVDGLGAKQLQFSVSNSVIAGSLVQGTPYVATYSNSDSVFYLHNYLAAFPFMVPIGALLPYVGSTAPTSNFVLPFGQAISRTTYATLFALVSTTFGVGDNSTTFNIPDLRGRSVFGLDNMGGSAASRITNGGSGIVGTTLGAAGGAETVTISQANLPAAALTTTITDPGHTHSIHESSTVGGTANSFVPAGSGSDLGTNGTAIVSNTTGITASTALGGSGTATNKMPPGIILPYILRVI